MESRKMVPKNLFAGQQWRNRQREHKKNEILQFAALRMNLEGTVLHEMSETDIHFMISKKYTYR